MIALIATGVFTPASAQILSNLGDAAVENLGVDANTSYAASFTTGTSNFTINSIDLREFVGGTDPNLTLSIYSDNSSSLPGTLLFKITNTSATGTPSIYQWTPSALISLSASTTYWLALSSTSEVGYVGWSATQSPSYVSSDGWSLNTATYADSSGFPWESTPGSSEGGDTMLFAINATATPEPDTWALVLLGGAGLYLLRHKRKSIPTDLSEKNE